MAIGPTMPLLEIRKLSAGMRFYDISLTVAQGEILGLIGPNGSGKSSLLQALAGILPYRGEIFIDGIELQGLPARTRAQQIGYLPQNGQCAWALHVDDVVALGRLPWQGTMVSHQKIDGAAIEAALRQADAQDLRNRRVDQLSQGEQARIWLARVLAGQPRLLLADEPIASLDLRHQRTVMETLRRTAENGCGVLLVIHDFSLAARYCQKLCLMQHGCVRAVGTPDEVFTVEHLSSVFETPVHVDLTANPPVIQAL